MKRAAAPAKTPKLPARVPLGSNVSTYCQSRRLCSRTQSHVVGIDLRADGAGQGEASNGTLGSEAIDIC